MPDKPHQCTSHECCALPEDESAPEHAQCLATRAEVAAYCAAHPKMLEELAEFGPYERAAYVYSVMHPDGPGLADVAQALSDALLHLREIPSSEPQANALAAVRRALAALYGVHVGDESP